MDGKYVSVRMLAMLAAAFACVVALGWLTGQRLPIARNRPSSDQPPAAERSELPLADQISTVERGVSATIQITAQPVGGREVAELGQLQGLQVLQLDHLENVIRDGDCQALARLDGLVQLRIRGGAIGDAGVALLAALPNLRILNLPQSRVTDRGLASLARAPRLRQLRLGSRQITDEGLKSLADFPALEQLHLIDAPITDPGLETMAALPKLDSLYLDGSRVTEAGLERLFRARPELHVHINQQHHDRDPRRGHD